MDNPIHLESNFKNLCTWMADLKYCKDQVEGRAEQGMDGWLQKVELIESEVDKLRRDLDELSGGRGSISRTALNKKVVGNIKHVEPLLNEFDAGPKSVNTSLDKVAKRYTVGEINKFISTFSKSKFSGNDGDIFTGQFDGKQVVVKVLPKKHVVDAIFITEVSTIARASHRHVVKLYGFCFSGDMRALVYEYVENGSFNKILYENKFSLAWEELYSIAIKVAKGIAYLHDECELNIILRDVRAHNVLLNKDRSPKVTGFGLAKLLEGDKSHCTLTRSRGVQGYAAPEMWLPASPITAKCDVYSFGIMLFEILGKRTNGIGRNCFSNQVWKKFKDGLLDQIIKECNIVQNDRIEATVLATLALWCVQMTPEIRPSMSDVVMVLQNKLLVTPPPNPFQHHPIQYTRMGLLPQSLIPRVSPTIHESLPERAEEFVSSSSSPSLKSSSSDHLNNTENSSTSIPRCGKATEILEQYQRKCPPGGEDSVIFYTTTFEKTKKPFKESNDVRSILQSHQIKMIERDVCGDGNYDDELDDLVGGPFIPAVFVKGRYIGGASEVKKLDEEGKLKMLFDGI